MDGARDIGRLNRKQNEGVERLVEKRSSCFQESENLARDRNDWKVIAYNLL